MQHTTDLFGAPAPHAISTPAKPLPVVPHPSIPSYRLQLVTERHVSYDAAKKVRTPSDAADFLRPMLCSEPREVFAVIMLSTANTITGLHISTTGGISSIVEPRSIFQAAILANAAAIICAHNHPSGNPEPSREDIAITRRITEAGKMLNIPLRDHVIITADTYTSLAERGLIS